MEPWFVYSHAYNISAHYELVVFVMALINSQSTPKRKLSSSKMRLERLPSFSPVDDEEELDFFQKG